MKTTSESPQVREVDIGNVPFGADHPFALIAGPCVIESCEHCLRHAEALQRIAREARVPLVFKSGFDKASLTSSGAFRGLGMDEGLAILAAVKSQLGLPVLTDFVLQVCLCRVARNARLGNHLPLLAPRPDARGPGTSGRVLSESPIFAIRR